MGFFKKKKSNLKSESFSGIREFNNSVNVNYLIIKLGGVANIIKAIHDNDHLIIRLRNLEDINFTHFKAHKTIRNFFVNRDDKEISLVFDVEIARTLAIKINKVVA